MKLSTSALLLALLLPTVGARTQSGASGTPPAERFAARDVFSEYNLPPLKDRLSNPLVQQERDTQVLERAERLSMDARAATAAWMAAGSLYAADLDFADGSVSAPPTEFTGNTASQLNALLASTETRVVKVSSATIKLDVPIVVHRSGIDIDFGTAQLVSVTGQPFLIRVEGAADVRLQSGTLTGSGWGMLIANSHHIAVSGITVKQATGGILVTNSRDVIIRNGEFHTLEEAAVLLHGNTHHALVLENHVSNNLGNSNWHAGIVVSDRTADLTVSPHAMMRPDNYGVQEQPITKRLVIPTDNLIAFNQIVGNSSSGIYSDGGSRNVYVQNLIEGNAKEGFCLDNGSTANVVIFNTIVANGKRWGKTDADLRRDFVYNLGRMPDGTSPAKLPGLSVDNAAYNLILFNNIHENFGGGVKMVRTAFFNVIGMNVLNQNNEGRSKTFHFFGIELGSATADVKVPDLDFRPSRGNEVFGNSIRGKHYAGIFFSSGSDANTIFDNSIFGATDWAMESVQPEKNQSFNNLSNLRCRNISTGIDPNLLTLGNGR